MNQQRRRPIIAKVVTTAFAVYGTYQLATWAWKTWIMQDDEKEDKEAEITHEQRPPHSAVNQQCPLRRHAQQLLQRQRMQRCREEIVTTLASFSVILRRIIDNATAVLAVKRQLKGLRQQADNKRDRNVENVLWMKIQVETIARMMATAYANAMLFVVLTVQVHLTAGYLFRKQMQRNSTAAVIAQYDTFNDDSHRQAMVLTFDTFWDHGLNELLHTVRGATQEAVSDLKITDPGTALHMTKANLLAIVHSIRSKVEQKQNLVQRFFVATCSDAAKKNGFLGETYDLLESPVVAEATTDCLNCMFELLEEQHLGPIFQQKESGIVFNDQPVVHVISQLKHATNSMYTEKEQYTAKMEKLVVETAHICFRD